LRTILEEPSDLEVCVINDLVPPDNLAYLLKYDTVHGPYGKPVTSDSSGILIEGRRIAVTGVQNPRELPWQKEGIDYVVESTGRFTRLEEAKKHLEAGAKRVIITAPGKDEIPTFVMGVNHTQYNPQSDFVLCNASCTTNCLAPLCQVLLENFGIEEGLMTTVHSLDSQSADRRRAFSQGLAGRKSCWLQYHSSEPTGAAKSSGQCVSRA